MAGPFRHVVLILAVLGAVSANHRQLMENQKLPSSTNNLPTCPDSTTLPVTETGVPGLKPELIITTRLEAYRNFTCAGGAANPYTEYYAKLNDDIGLWFGLLYYDSSGFPTFDFSFQEPGAVNETKRTIVTFKEVTEIPSPLPGNAPWGRYKVFSDTGYPPFQYVERSNTLGGAPPIPCEKDAVSVFYKATYNFFMCAEGASSPSPSVISSPSPSVITSPTTPVITSPTMVTPSPAPIMSPTPIAESPSPAVVSPSTVTPSPPSSSSSPSSSPSPSPSPAPSPSAAVHSAVFSALAAVMSLFVVTMLV